MVKNFLNEVMVKKPTTANPFDALVKQIESGYLAVGEPEFKTKKNFSPSSLVYGSGACPRYWHLAFTGAVYIPDNGANPTQIASMRNGTLSHERIQNAMRASGVLKDSEVKIISDDPPIYAFADAIIEWNGETYVGEIKTVRTEAFEYRKASGKPTDYHVKQLLIYMREKKIDKGLLIYEDKNSHELLILPVEMTPERSAWLDQLYAWMREVHKAWKKGKLAQKPYRSNSKVCKDCPLQPVCAASPAGDVKIDKLAELS